MNLQSLEDTHVGYALGPKKISQLTNSCDQLLHWDESTHLEGTSHCWIRFTENFPFKYTWVLRWFPVSWSFFMKFPHNVSWWGFLVMFPTKERSADFLYTICWYAANIYTNTIYNLQFLSVLEISLSLKLLPKSPEGARCAACKVGFQPAYDVTLCRSVQQAPGYSAKSEIQPSARSPNIQAFSSSE